MEPSRSREALAEFLNYLGNKGLMSKASVDARKAAASKILAILDPDEASDLSKLDVDEVVDRFSHLHGKNYTPESLATYRSRLRSALSDFLAYSKNPLGFKPSVQNRERTTSKTVKDSAENSQSSDKGRDEYSRQEATRAGSAPLPSNNILPIQIRADLTIYVQGIPFDLSEAEAKKISGVITAMAGG